jgi:hypothetical protein
VAAEAGAVGAGVGVEATDAPASTTAGQGVVEAVTSPTVKRMNERCTASTRNLYDVAHVRPATVAATSLVVPTRRPLRTRLYDVARGTAFQLNDTVVVELPATESAIEASRLDCCACRLSTSNARFAVDSWPPEAMLGVRMARATNDVTTACRPTRPRTEVAAWIVVIGLSSGNPATS